MFAIFVPVKCGKSAQINEKDLNNAVVSIDWHFSSKHFLRRFPRTGLS